MAPKTKSYKILGIVSSDAKGAYSFKYKTSVKGSWMFRTSFADPATGMTASSIPETVKVK